MKKLILAGVIFLLISLIFEINTPETSAATETTADLRVFPDLPKEAFIPREPMPENFTTEDYFNTTNSVIQGDPLDEVDDPEGDFPIYVLIVYDEEGEPIDPTASSWYFEKADEALIANWGIDIRILGFADWDSDDSLYWMSELWYELSADFAGYIGQWYEGEYWSNYIDAVIGITGQATYDSTPGMAPGPKLRDQGEIFILLKWMLGWPWANDNLVQHEVSHLFYADDHCDTCCAMAYHTHYQIFYWEDLHWWPVFADVPCSLTSYGWCTDCSNVISCYPWLYYNRDYILAVRHGDPYHPHGELSLPIGVYGDNIPFEVTISVVSTHSDWEFAYWLIDGNQKVNTTSVTISVDGKHAVAAYFTILQNNRRGGGSRNVHYCVD